MRMLFEKGSEGRGREIEMSHDMNLFSPRMFAFTFTNY